MGLIKSHINYHVDKNDESSYVSSCKRFLISAPETHYNDSLNTVLRVTEC